MYPTRKLRLSVLFFSRSDFAVGAGLWNGKVDAAPAVRCRSGSAAGPRTNGRTGGRLMAVEIVWNGTRSDVETIQNPTMKTVKFELGNHLKAKLGGGGFSPLNAGGVSPTDCRMSKVHQESSDPVGASLGHQCQRFTPMGLKWVAASCETTKWVRMPIYIYL